MNNENRGTFASFMISALLGSGVCAVTALALLFLFSAVLLFTGDPGKHTVAAALTALSVSSFLGGFTGAKKGSSVFVGVVSGVLFALLLFVFSLFMKESETVASIGGSIYSLSSKAGVIALSALGAITASKTHKRKRSLKAAPRAPKIKKL